MKNKINEIKFFFIARAFAEAIEKILLRVEALAIKRKNT